MKRYPGFKACFFQMVATCAGYILARIRSIAEIMGNNLDVHRHRRLTYIEQARPDKAGRRDSG
jgi:hypothetical protein